MNPITAVVSVVTLTAGSTLSNLAQAVTQEPSDALPWVSGASGGAALGLFAYLLKKFLDGDMVARPTAEREKHLEGLLAAGAVRELAWKETSEHMLTKWGEHDGKCEKREEALRKALADSAQALWEHERHGR